MGIIIRRLQEYMKERNYFVLNYNKYPSKKESIPFIQECIKTSQLKGSEAFMVYSLSKNICKKMKGSLAEIGCFRGGQQN